MKEENTMKNIIILQKKIILNLEFSHDTKEW